jgi:Zinc finger C-x8-C-x5-C-x3-H type (and similar)
LYSALFFFLLFFVLVYSVSSTLQSLPKSTIMSVSLADSQPSEAVPGVVPSAAVETGDDATSVTAALAGSDDAATASEESANTILNVHDTLDVDPHTEPATEPATELATDIDVDGDADADADADGDGNADGKLQNGRVAGQRSRRRRRGRRRNGPNRQHPPENYNEFDPTETGDAEGRRRRRELFPVGTYKTEICRAHQITGYCEYGDNCQFAHGYHQLRPRSYDAKYKTQLCRNFHVERNCQFGLRCKFIHDEVRLMINEQEYWLVSPSENLIRIEQVDNAQRAALLQKLASSPPPVAPQATHEEEEHRIQIVNAARMAANARSAQSQVMGIGQNVAFKQEPVPKVVAMLGAPFAPMVYNQFQFGNGYHQQQHHSANNDSGNGTNANASGSGTVRIMQHQHQHQVHHPNMVPMMGMQMMSGMPMGMVGHHGGMAMPNGVPGSRVPNNMVPMYMMHHSPGGPGVRMPPQAFFPSPQAQMTVTGQQAQPQVSDPQEDQTGDTQVQSETIVPEASVAAHTEITVTETDEAVTAEATTADSENAVGPGTAPGAEAIPVAAAATATAAATASS